MRTDFTNYIMNIYQKLNELHWQLQSYSKTYMKHMHNIQYARNHILLKLFVTLTIKDIKYQLKNMKGYKDFLNSLKGPES